MDIRRSFRMQMYCDKNLREAIQHFAKDRDITESAAIKKLVERSLSSDGLSSSLYQREVLSRMDSLLHAVSFSRVLLSDLVHAQGLKLDQDVLKERVTKMVVRYKSD